MRIAPIFNMLSFTSNVYDNPNIFGFDDEISRNRRIFIRQHYNEYKMPYQDIYENEPKLEKYQLNKLLDFFAKKPKNINGEDIYHLPLANVHNISTLKRYTPNIYRGSTLYDAPDWVLDKLKKAGIQRVIDLAGYGDLYKNKVERHGLEYVPVSINTMRSDYYVNSSRKEELIKFIKTMQKEYVYMGCEFGTYKTDAAVLLNSLFNPKVKAYCKIYSPEKIEYIPKIANKLYHLMSSQDKKEIGWTPEFEKLFNKKITSMLHL